jgi:hypothetical protein
MQSQRNRESWTACNTGLTHTLVHSIYTNGSDIYAGTHGGGAFFSNNNGTSWTAFNTGLENLYINSFSMVGEVIFAGADRGSVWSYGASTTENNELNINSSVLVYPNPMIDHATLEFENSKNENFTLTILDFQGRPVQTYNHIMTNKIEIEKNNLQSGLYFFQLNSGNQIRAAGKFLVD